MVFERSHHQRIARVLESLDGAWLRSQQCWFGGGTAIAMLQGEYRESVDIDFLVSDLAGYRELRQRLVGARDLGPLMQPGRAPIALTREARADQYGVRTFLDVEGAAIKFEIVHEGRIAFEAPGRNDRVCGIATLSRTDLAASKLLANADRWRDDIVFARDAIDLAMLDLPPRRLKPALDKAVGAYGANIATDMRRALEGLRQRSGWLRRCIQALSIDLPLAAVQQQLRGLTRRLALASGVTD